MFEEARWLPRPDAKANFIDRVHQGLDIMGFEPAAKITRSRGIWDPLRAQGIQVDFVVAKPLEVFQASTSGQGVVGDVQNVVRFVVGQVDFQQLQGLVDLLHQPHAPDQLMDRPDSPRTEAARSLRELVVNVRRPEHRTALVAPIAISKTTLDSALAVSKISACTLLHSKRPSLWDGSWLVLPSYLTEMGFSRALAMIPYTKAIRSRWFKG